MNDRFRFRAWLLKTEEMDYECVPFHKDLWGNTGILGKHFVVDAGNFIVMQSTGLRDKNGKLIFEGDIVAHQKLGSIHLSIGLVSIETTRGVCVGGWPIELYPEVIGNIHQNPEFLEEKK